MIRRVGLALVALAVVSPLGGCAVSLFSKQAPDAVDAERVDRLERRIDAVERALPQR